VLGGFWEKEYDFGEVVGKGERGQRGARRTFHASRERHPEGNVLLGGDCWAASKLFCHTKGELWFPPA
jgi:hypothetical protein